MKTGWLWLFPGIGAVFLVIVPLFVLPPLFGKRRAAQWLNPQTNKLHVFRSENLWPDPGPYISDSLVTVMIEPNNPKRYSMDTRFLPELAD